MGILFFIALLVLCPSVFLAVGLLNGLRRMQRLADIPEMGTSSSAQPQISVIVPACNEEESIVTTVRGLYAQSYGNLEVLVVNDRSTDGTGDLLATLKNSYPELRVTHVDELPEDWMGKANALQLGANMASGEYLLFIDGDIQMEESSIARAVNHMQREELDHLSVTFSNTTKGLLLNSLILESLVSLFFLFRPWRVRDTKAREFIGIGAFNMVRKSVYEKVGGHSKIRMHPVDDVMLGKIIKRNGFQQDCLLGIDMISVPWYATIKEMMNGLQKNSLSLIHYNFWLLPPLLAGVFLFSILPLWGLFFTSAWAQLIFAAIVLLRIVFFLIIAWLYKLSPLCAPGTLITPYITFYIVLRTAWLNYRDDGIYWRGTHYPLKRLRRNMPILP